MEYIIIFDCLRDLVLFYRLLAQQSELKLACRSCVLRVSFLWSLCLVSSGRELVSSGLCGRAELHTWKNGQLTKVKSSTSMQRRPFRFLLLFAEKEGEQQKKKARTKKKERKNAKEKKIKKKTSAPRMRVFEPRAPCGAVPQ